MKGRHHQALVEQARGLDPIRTAVVHPVDTVVGRRGGGWI